HAEGRDQGSLKFRAIQTQVAGIDDTETGRDLLLVPLTGPEQCTDHPGWIGCDGVVQGDVPAGIGLVKFRIRPVAVKAGCMTRLTKPLRPASKHPVLAVMRPVDTALNLVIADAPRALFEEVPKLIHTLARTVRF